ncbi:signal recognition particle-docking protein FtsY [Candidatus Poribacteria bacterium]|nr:signal recognition particle-docking protein FtsY [Candidatus Poribacteria bacterium]
MLRGIFGRKRERDDRKAAERRKGLFDRLRDGLSKTRQNILGRMSSIIQGRTRIDEELMEEIEEVLIQADVGVETTLKLMERVRETVQERGVQEPSQLIGILKEEMLRIFGEDRPLDVGGAKPYSIMILGVNGVGKTTTIGKLAARFKGQGLKTLVAAGDTFRAAASDQLEIWCQRAGVELIKGAEGGDPAAVVFDSIQAAKARNADVLIVDTAGRLHTKKPLMMELQKIARVMGRELPGAPHEVLLVLDATTGQNAIMQAKTFNEAVPVTGIALTKLDGTAKGGIVLAVRDTLGIPVKLIGVGEGIEDLRDFNAREFVEALFD